jgi:hypothetical protein
MNRGVRYFDFAQFVRKVYLGPGILALRISTSGTARRDPWPRRQRLAKIQGLEKIGLFHNDVKSGGGKEHGSDG